MAWNGSSPVCILNDTLPPNNETVGNNETVWWIVFPLSAVFGILIIFLVTIPLWRCGKRGEKSVGPNLESCDQDKYMSIPISTGSQASDDGKDGSMVMHSTNLLGSNLEGSNLVTPRNIYRQPTNVAQRGATCDSPPNSSEDTSSASSGPAEFVTPNCTEASTATHYSTEATNPQKGCGTDPVVASEFQSLDIKKASHHWAINYPTDSTEVCAVSCEISD